VHGEREPQFSKSGFRRFLCSGMTQSVQVVAGKEQRLGSYHQCYRLDGRLVAVGVLDLLPGCVSSVYLM
jgi:arginyl-tRNA---protein transferase